MTKKTRNILGLFILVLLLILVALFWAFNHRIIEGSYDKVTITKLGESKSVITDKTEIENIMKTINDSPRTYNPQNGFRYDYVPHGFLQFENENEEVIVEFIIPKGNVLTKYWEIETEFEFGKDME
ncbi:hypothetical protein [Fredinandcohnia sp. 179-A 10B2 NHS]|uniref:hypothetical protein n=1 Tax=Fredinandcohnia sp. 179-A 10B2 NHS TaxID=3235176 RepID=UPI0039A218E6